MSGGVRPTGWAWYWAAQTGLGGDSFFFKVLTRPTGLGGIRFFKVLVHPTGLRGVRFFFFWFKYWFTNGSGRGAGFFLSTGLPNGSWGGGFGFLSTGSPNGSWGRFFLRSGSPNWWWGLGLILVRPNRLGGYTPKSSKKNIQNQAKEGVQKGCNRGCNPKIV